MSENRKDLACYLGSKFTGHKATQSKKFRSTGKGMNLHLVDDMSSLDS